MNNYLQINPSLSVNVLSTCFFTLFLPFSTGVGGIISSSLSTSAGIGSGSGDGDLSSSNSIFEIGQKLKLT